MSFEQIISIISVCLTAIGLILVIFGWIIPHNQNIKMENLRKKEDLIFRKTQWEKIISMHKSLNSMGLSLLFYKNKISCLRESCICLGEDTFSAKIKQV